MGHPGRDLTEVFLADGVEAADGKPGLSFHSATGKHKAGGKVRSGMPLQILHTFNHRAKNAPVLFALDHQVLHLSEQPVQIF
jgi:hypothetical protein